jgi:hypothetical protein
MAMTIYSQHPSRGKVQILATYRRPGGVTSSTVTSVDSVALAAPIVGALNRVAACATVPVSVYDRRDDRFDHYPRTHLAALTDQGARADLLTGTHSLWYEHAMLLLHAALTDLDDAMADVPAPVRTAIAAELAAEASGLRDALAEYSEGTPLPETEDQRCWDFGAPFVAFDGGMEALSGEHRDGLNRHEHGATAEERGKVVADLRLLVEAYERCDNQDAALEPTELAIWCDPCGPDRYYLTVDAPLPRGVSGRADWRVDIGQWDIDIDDPQNEERGATGESVLCCARTTPPSAPELAEVLNISGERPELLAEWAKTPVGEALASTAFIVTERHDS